MADPPKNKNFRQSKAYRTLRQAMLADLEIRGLKETVYTDKVEEYMDFWVLRQELKADISQRGLIVVDDRGRLAENRSISLAVQVSRQMMTLFGAMGFKASDFMGAGADDAL